MDRFRALQVFGGIKDLWKEMAGNQKPCWIQDLLIGKISRIEILQKNGETRHL